MSVLLLIVLGIVIVISLTAYQSYFQYVGHLSAQIKHQHAKGLPGSPPRFFFGNMLEVYRSSNQLSAYHQFHERFGEIVQIFWMWRLQVSTASYQMAEHILVSEQKKYKKYPPNSILRKLYGSSILTNEGDAWNRQRRLMHSVFAKKQISSFQDTFVSYSELLASKWLAKINSTESAIDIYPDLLNLFFDIIGQATIGYRFGALEGKVDNIRSQVNYLIAESTKPQHQFTSWWKYIPLPANLRLWQAFTAVDTFLYSLIQKRREELQHSEPDSHNVLDLLLNAAEWSEGQKIQLSDREVRDNLLAIILNGHETVATSVSFTLYLLALHPQELTLAQAEADQWYDRMQAGQVSELPFIESAINESLRLYPPMAGLQRVSTQADTLGEWSIPANQVIGIPLAPLHLSAAHFGPQPEQFSPARYLGTYLEPSIQAAVASVNARKCPLAVLHRPTSIHPASETISPRSPLSFGDGARKCLGEHFARAEMKIAIAILLHQFTFEVIPGQTYEPELGKFGLFISMFPKNGIKMILSSR